MTRAHTGANWSLQSMKIDFMRGTARKSEISALHCQARALLRLTPPRAMNTCCAPHCWGLVRGRCGNMSEERKALFIKAWPAGHSRSPLIHNYWIKQHKLYAEYRREAVPPEQFANFLRSMRDRRFVGANVTVPHKETALHLTQ